MKRMVENFEKKERFFAPGQIERTRKLLLDWVIQRAASPQWNIAVQVGCGPAVSLDSKSVVTPALSQPIPTPTPSSTSSAVSTPMESITAALTSTSLVTTENVFRVCFTDMWDDFNPQYNFFTLMLQEASKKFKTPFKIEGHTKFSLKDQKPSVVIFGPFGNEWKTFDKSIPKIH